MRGYPHLRSGGTTFIMAMRRGQIEAPAALIIICSTIITTGFFTVRHTAAQGLISLIKYAKVCAGTTHRRKAPTGPPASLCNNTDFVRPAFYKNIEGGYFYAFLSNLL